MSASRRDSELPHYDSRGAVPVQDTKVPPTSDASITGHSAGLSTSTDPGMAGEPVYAEPRELTEEQRAEQERVEKLPSALFAIPFPPPSTKDKLKDGAIPFLLYMPPRSVYKKPEVQEDGKPEKEGLVKKIERKWQEEIKEGEDIKRGDIPEASRWQKMKGGATRAASAVIKFMPDTVIEALGRLPPGKKLGPIMVLYPETPYPELSQGRTLTQEDMRDQLDQLLMVTKKKANRNKYISALTLPVTATIDFFVVVPIFAFEMNCAYFAGQVAGSRKVNTLTKKPKEGEEQVNHFHFVPSYAPSPTIHESHGEYSAHSHALDAQFQTSPTPNNNQSTSVVDPFKPILALFYALCHELKKTEFPLNANLSNLHSSQENPDVSTKDKKTSRSKLVFPVETPLGQAVVGPSLVKGLLERFRATVPKEVWERHVLDEERVAEDLERCMRKGAKEYVKAL